jgi:hypothetical protein
VTDFDDDRATWRLLSASEQRALAVLARYKGNVITPVMLGHELGFPWQRAARLAASLSTFGLVTVTSLSKQTSYKISGQGEACLAAGRGQHHDR